jgi:hypothetical protein
MAHEHGDETLELSSEELCDFIFYFFYLYKRVHMLQKTYTSKLFGFLNKKNRIP